MTIERMLVKIGSDNDQDRAACDQWMREASYADKLAVWMRIQVPRVDPVDEIVTRFAQLAFGESLTRTMEQKQ